MSQKPSTTDAYYAALARPRGRQEVQSASLRSRRQNEAIQRSFALMAEKRQPLPDTEAELDRLEAQRAERNQWMRDIVDAVEE